MTVARCQGADPSTPELRRSVLPGDARGYFRKVEGKSLEKKIKMNKEMLGEGTERCGAPSLSAAPSNTIEKGVSQLQIATEKGGESKWLSAVTGIGKGAGNKRVIALCRVEAQAGRVP